MFFSCIRDVYCAIYVPQNVQDSGWFNTTLTRDHYSPLSARVHCSQKHSGLAGWLAASPYYVTAFNHTDARGEQSERAAHTLGTAGISSMSGPVGFRAQR